MYLFFEKLCCKRQLIRKKMQTKRPCKQKPQPSLKPLSFSLLFFSAGKATTAGERKFFLLATKASRHHFIQQIQEKKAAERRQWGRTNPGRRRLGPLSGLLLPNEELCADRMRLMEEREARVSMKAWKEERAFYCPLNFYLRGEKIRTTNIS